MPLFYDALRSAFRVASNIFYATTEVNGLENLPKEGDATILCFNHGNSLGDPVMLMRTTPRTISFCAKDALWKAPLFGMMVRNSGAVPVYRAKDHGNKAKDFNQETFRAVYTALYEGRCVGFAPEGVSRFKPFMAPLKTGTAHIALEAVYQRMEIDPDFSVKIQPVGLQFTHREKFRSDAVVSYLKPIVVDKEWLKEGRFETRKDAAKALTDMINQALHAVTTNAPDWEYSRAAMTAMRLHQPHGTLMTLTEYVFLLRGWIEVFKRYTNGPPSLANKTPDEDKLAALPDGHESEAAVAERETERKEDERLQQVYSELWTALQRYQHLLDVKQIKDERVRRYSFPGVINLNKAFTIGRMLFRALVVVVSFGIAGPGLILWSPFWFLIKRRERQLMANGPTWVDSLAENKMMLATMFVLLVVLFSNIFAPLALIYLLITLRLYEEGVASARSFYSLHKLLFIYKSTMVQMQQLRKEAKEQVDVVVELGLLPESAITGKCTDSGKTGTSGSKGSPGVSKGRVEGLLVEPIMMAPFWKNFNPLRRRKKDWNEILRLNDSNTMNYVE